MLKTGLAISSDDRERVRRLREEFGVLVNIPAEVMAHEDGAVLLACGDCI